MSSASFKRYFIHVCVHVIRKHMFRACLKVCVGGDKRAAWRKRALSFLGRAIALSIKLLKFLSSASNVKVAFTHHSFDVGHLLAVITILLL